MTQRTIIGFEGCIDHLAATYGASAFLDEDGKTVRNGVSGLWCSLERFKEHADDGEATLIEGIAVDVPDDASPYVFVAIEPARSAVTLPEIDGVNVLAIQSRLDMLVIVFGSFERMRFYPWVRELVFGADGPIRW